MNYLKCIPIEFVLDLHIGSSSPTLDYTQMFSEWILNIVMKNYYNQTINISILLSLMRYWDFDDPIEAIIISNSLNLLQNYTNSQFLRSKVILTSIIEIVDDINDYITYLLSDN